MNGVVSIDIGGTKTKIGIVDPEGHILYKNGFATDKHLNEESFLEELKNTINQALRAVEGIHVLGIGIGAPMANYHTGIVRNPANLKWKKDVNLKEFLEQTFQLKTVVTNDANLSAMGEKRFGLAKQLKTFISIIIGTGLGAGIYMNNQLMHGHHGLVGELGHTTSQKDGRLCQCGKKGCLETYVSASGLKRTFFSQLVKYNLKSTLRDISFNALSAEHICDAALEGDVTAQRAFRFTGKMLGIKIADAILSIEPEAVFLSGGLANAGDLLLTPTRENVKKYLIKDYPEVPIKVSNLPADEISLVGGSALIWDHLKM
jgi:glucokinase